MKKTLMLPDHLLRELALRAAERGVTLSAVVAETLRRGLAQPDDSAVMVPLPVHHMGRPTVDLADRAALYRAMENV